MPPSDSAPSRNDPATELAQLRRNMVQQLAASGKLTRAVFDIDRDYFGARFLTKAQESAASPFRDLEVATQVVETLGEELQGAAAFADSPVLRDHIANLVAGIEELRAMLIQMEQASLQSVGLPTDKVALKARVYPETNPLACLAETTGFVRESHAWIVRTVERIKGLGLMLEEAERARADAESSVHQISGDEITATLTAEIEARDRDLTDLRQRATDLQDQVNALTRAGAIAEGGLREEITRLSGELEAAADQVTSDQAEVRSLVVEIERLAADCEQEGRPDGRDKVDDLAITVQVLREAVQDRQTPIATLTTAADAVLREWFAWMHRREELNLEELAQTRAFVAKHEKAQELASKADGAPREQPEMKASADRLAQELNAARQQAAATISERDRLIAELRTAAEQQATATKTATEQAAAALTAAKAQQERTGAAAKAAMERSVALDKDLTQARAEIDRLRVAEVAARGAGETAQQAAASAALAAAQADAKQAREAAAAAKTQADQATAVASEKAAEADRLRAAAAQAKADLDAAMKACETAKADAHAARSHANQSQAKIEQAQAEAQKAQAEATKLRIDIDAARQSIVDAEAKARSATDAAQRKVTDAGGEVTRLQGQINELQATAKQARSEIERLGGELVKTSPLAGERERLVKELDQQKQQRERLERELAEARQQRDRAVADLATARDQAAAAVGRIDATAHEHVHLVQERDGLQAQLEQLRVGARQAAEQAAKAAAALDQELAQVRGKVAESEQLKTSALKERDESRARLDEMRRSTESLSSQSVQMQEGLAKELQSLRDAEQQARSQLAAAEGKVAQQESRLAALERDLAQSKLAVSARQSDIDRLSKEVAAHIQTVRERESAIAKAVEDGRAASAKLAREIEQLQGKLAGAETRERQAAQEREAWNRHKAEAVRDRQQLDEKIKQTQAKHKELQGEIDSTKLVATAAASERDKLRRDVERLQGEQSQVGKKLEERETQLTARLTETSRQLAELKQVAARLEGERDRARAEVEHIQGERKKTAESRAREGTAVWTKRLTDSAADLEELKVRAAGLERALGEAKTREAALAKQHEPQRNRSTVAASVAVGDAQTRLVEMKALLIEARAAVVHAKGWKDSMEQRLAEVSATDQAIITSLMAQVKALGGTPKV